MDALLNQGMEYGRRLINDHMVEVLQWRRPPVIDPQQQALVPICNSVEKFIEEERQCWVLPTFFPSRQALPDSPGEADVGAEEPSVTKTIPLDFETHGAQNTLVNSSQLSNSSGSHGSKESANTASANNGGMNTGTRINIQLPTDVIAALNYVEQQSLATAGAFLLDNAVVMEDVQRILDSMMNPGPNTDVQQLIPMLRVALAPLKSQIMAQRQYANPYTPFFPAQGPPLQAMGPASVPFEEATEGPPQGFGLSEPMEPEWLLLEPAADSLGDEDFGPYSPQELISARASLMYEVQIENSSIWQNIRYKLGIRPDGCRLVRRVDGDNIWIPQCIPDSWSKSVTLVQADRGLPQPDACAAAAAGTTVAGAVQPAGGACCAAGVSGGRARGADAATVSLSQASSAVKQATSKIAWGSGAVTTSGSTQSSLLSDAGVFNDDVSTETNSSLSTKSENCSPAGCVKGDNGSNSEVVLSINQKTVSEKVSQCASTEMQTQDEMSNIGLVDGKDKTSSSEFQSSDCKDETNEVNRYMFSSACLQIVKSLDYLQQYNFSTTERPSSNEICEHSPLVCSNSLPKTDSSSSPDDRQGSDSSCVDGEQRSTGSKCLQKRRNSEQDVQRDMSKRQKL